MVNAVIHNGVDIGAFIIFCFLVKYWFNWEGGGAETLRNRGNSVAFSDKVIWDMR